MVYCCALLCKSRSNSKQYKSGDRVSFHEFPSNIERRAIWIKNVNRKDWFPSDTQRLCSKHFTDDQYKVGKKHCVLLPDAVPTVFEERNTQSRQAKSSTLKKSERSRRKKPVSPDATATMNSEETKLSKVPSETGDEARFKTQETSSESDDIAKINEEPQLVKTAHQIAENDKSCYWLETSVGTVETAKNSPSPRTTASNGENPELPEVSSESRLAPKSGSARRLIVVSKGTSETAENGKRFRLVEIPRRLGETANNGKRYKLMEISSEVVEHAKNAKRLKLSTISGLTANNGQTPKLPNISSYEKVETDIPWPEDVEQHLATERKLKANQKMIYRLKAKVTSQKNEIESLKATLQKFTTMPLLETVQNIEQAASEDKLHAKFLLCQIKGFGKKRILWDDKLVRCFKHWRAMSAKGYDFPRSCGLLRLPHPSSLGRYADSSQVDAAIASAIEDLGQGPEVISEEIQEATILFDDCEVAIATITSEDCTTVVDVNSIDQFPYTCIL